MFTVEMALSAVSKVLIEIMHALLDLQASLTHLITPLTVYKIINMTSCRKCSVGIQSTTVLCCWSNIMKTRISCMLVCRHGMLLNTRWEALSNIHTVVANS